MLTFTRDGRRLSPPRWTWRDGLAALPRSSLWRMPSPPYCRSWSFLMIGSGKSFTMTMGTFRRIPHTLMNAICMLAGRLRLVRRCRHKLSHSPMFISLPSPVLLLSFPKWPLTHTRGISYLRRKASKIGRPDQALEPTGAALFVLVLIPRWLENHARPAPIPCHFLPKTRLRLAFASSFLGNANSFPPGGCQHRLERCQQAMNVCQDRPRPCKHLRRVGMVPKDVG